MPSRHSPASLPCCWGGPQCGWETANWLGAAGRLLLVTPLAVMVLAFVNYAFVSLLLGPVRWLLQRRVQQTPRNSGSGSEPRLRSSFAWNRGS
jgi:hypothetical protein